MIFLLISTWLIHPIVKIFVDIDQLDKRMVVHVREFSMDDYHNFSVLQIERLNYSLQLSENLEVHFSQELMIVRKNSSLNCLSNPFH